MEVTEKAGFKEEAKAAKRVLTKANDIKDNVSVMGRLGTKPMNVCARRWMMTPTTKKKQIQEASRGCATWWMKPRR